MIILPGHASPVVPVHRRSRLLEPDKAAWIEEQEARHAVGGIDNIVQARDDFGPFSLSPDAPCDVLIDDPPRHPVGVQVPLVEEEVVVDSMAALVFRDLEHQLGRGGTAVVIASPARVAVKIDDTRRTGAGLASEFSAGTA